MTPCSANSSAPSFRIVKPNFLPIVFVTELPIPFVTGANKPFTAPVAKSYNKSFPLYSFPVARASPALIPILTPAPTVPAIAKPIPRLAPPVGTASANAPTANMPEAISATTSTTIFWPSL